MNTNSNMYAVVHENLNLDRDWHSSWWVLGTLPQSPNMDQMGSQGEILDPTYPTYHWMCVRV